MVTNPTKKVKTTPAPDPLRQGFDRFVAVFTKPFSSRMRYLYTGIHDDPHIFVIGTHDANKTKLYDTDQALAIIVLDDEQLRLIDSFFSYYAVDVHTPLQIIDLRTICALFNKNKKTLSDIVITQSDGRYCSADAHVVDAVHDTTEDDSSVVDEPGSDDPSTADETADDETPAKTPVDPKTCFLSNTFTEFYMYRMYQNIAALYIDSIVNQHPDYEVYHLPFVDKKSRCIRIHIPVRDRAIKQCRFTVIKGLDLLSVDHLVSVFPPREVGFSIWGVCNESLFHGAYLYRSSAVTICATRIHAYTFLPPRQKDILL